MSQITVDIPDASLADLSISPQALAVEMKMAAACLYAQHRMSVHQAARFAGIDAFTFRQRLGDYGVAVFDLTREELEAENWHDQGGGKRHNAAAIPSSIAHARSAAQIIRAHGCAPGGDRGVG